MLHAPDAWPAAADCYLDALDEIAGVEAAKKASWRSYRYPNFGAGDAAAIAALLRDAGTIPPPGSDPLRPAPALPPAPAGSVHGGRPAPAGCLAAPAMPGPVMPALPAPVPPADAPPRPAPRPADAPARAAAAANGAPAADTTRPVHLVILGPPRITAAGKEISGGLRKARELLAFLALHKDGATAEAFSEALWPEADPPAVTASARPATCSAPQPG
jgi:hypothetical protein